YNGMTLPVAPTLMVEFEGTAADVAAQFAQFRTLAETYAATLADEATEVEESTRIWQARHDALPASLSLVPGSSPMISDVCV
ncbi:FAD-linked oxidase C-terminal domain-containing protein, partial [Bradyrhizobium cosmicum]|uniref:FAD-linked oxidase C-terminal domain-containing protein n=1 Tax=Bradyrhizobium cosmicum TaxID=1404864 RepID=UPI0028EAE16E